MQQAFTVLDSMKPTARMIILSKKAWLIEITKVLVLLKADHTVHTIMIGKFSVTRMVFSKNVISTV